MVTWAEREREFSALRDAAVGAVVRWLYGDELGRWHDPRPLIEQRSGEEPPRGPSERKPAAGAPMREYGVDASGGVVLMRERDGVGVVCDEVSVRHGNGIEWRLAFYGPRDPVRPRLGRDFDRYVMRRVLRAYEDAAGRITRCTLETGPAEDDSQRDRFDVRWWERYVYDEEGRVEVIEVREGLPEEDGRLRERHVASYRKDGRLALLVENVEGFSVEYRLLTKPMKRYVEVVERQLTAALTRAVEECGREEPVAVVSISFEEGLLPPLVGISGGAEWAAAKEGADDLEALWNPAHFDFRLCDVEEFDFPDRDAYEAAAGAVEQGGDGHDFGALAVRLAQDLNEHTWPAGVTSPDFVAVAVQCSMEDLRRWAMHSLPAQRFSELVVAGLL